MKYPKLWHTDHAVGQARVRGLQQVGLGFLNAYGPGFVSRLKGNTCEVIVDEQRLDTVFSITDPAHGPWKVRAQGAINAKKFHAKGDLQATPYSAQYMLPTGGNWDYLPDIKSATSIQVNFDVLRSFNGKNGKKLFSSFFNVPQPNLTVAGYAYSLFVEHRPFFFQAGIRIVEEDQPRQKPVLYGKYLNDDRTTWADFVVDLSSLCTVNTDYSLPNVAFLLPTVWLVWFAARREMPRVYLTLDEGGSWLELDSSQLYPDVYESHDGAGDVILVAAANSMQVTPISITKVVITVRYPHTPAGDVVGTTETVYDVFSGGTVLVQYLHRPEAKFWGVHALGIRAYLRYRDDGANSAGTDGVSFPEVTTDAGASFTAVTLQPAVMSFPRAHGDYHEREDHTKVNPTAYYVVHEEGEKRLYSSKDMFATSKKSSVIAGADLAPTGFDYTHVSELGAIDPTFPWRVDARVHPPERWYDGITH